MVDFFEQKRRIAIRRSQICEDKKLATHCLNLGLLCGNGCYYCVSPALVQTHNIFKELSTTSSNLFDQNIAMVDPWTPDRVNRESCRLNPKDTVLLSTITDPYSIEAERNCLARKCLEPILTNSNAKVRIQTKNAGILSDLNYLVNFPNRVQVAMNLTAPLSKQSVIRILEPKASPIDHRLYVLQKAVKHYIPIYGMFSPCIPGIISSKDDLQEIFETVVPFNPTGIWVEPLNPRDRNINRCVDALNDNSEYKIADLLDSITDKRTYVDYVSDFINTTTEVANSLNCLDKLHVLVYGNKDNFKVNEKAPVIWLKR